MFGVTKLVHRLKLTSLIRSIPDCVHFYTNYKHENVFLAQTSLKMFDVNLKIELMEETHTELGPARVITCTRLGVRLVRRGSTPSF